MQNKLKEEDSALVNGRLIVQFKMNAYVRSRNLKVVIFYSISPPWHLVLLQPCTVVKYCAILYPIPNITDHNFNLTPGYLQIGVRRKNWKSLILFKTNISACLPVTWQSPTFYIGCLSAKTNIFYELWIMPVNMHVDSVNMFVKLWTNQQILYEHR